MKLLFRFPEILLLFAIVSPPLIVGNSSLDIQLHDTYFVFGSTSWGINLFFVLIMLILGITWILHILCRKFQLLHAGWRWAQVIITLLCVAILVMVTSSSLFLDKGGRYNYAAWERYSFLSAVTGWSMLIFTCSQLIFWISVMVAGIRKMILARRPVV